MGILKQNIAQLEDKDEGKGSDLSERETLIAGQFEVEHKIKCGPKIDPCGNTHLILSFCPCVGGDG